MVCFLSHLKIGQTSEPWNSQLWKRNGDINREVLQTEYRYDFWKGPREYSASTVFTVFICVIALITVNTVPAEISRGPFWKSYRNSVCKTSLLSQCVLHANNTPHRCLALPWTTAFFTAAMNVLTAESQNFRAVKAVWFGVYYLSDGIIFGRY